MTKKNAIIIKASDYKYPTRKELSEVYKATPDLHSFGFKSEHPFTNLITRQRTIQEVHRDDHLHHWDGILLNRNGSLSHTYHNALVHYSREIPDKLTDFEHRHYINRIQFDYYAEIFYYYFTTVADTLGQILNVYYNFNIPVDKIYFSYLFIKDIPNQDIVNAVKSFFKETAQAKEFRNSFTHRTPINYPDTRSTVQLDISQLIYGSAANSFVKSSEIKANLDVTFHAMAKLLDFLKPFLPQDH